MGEGKLGPIRMDLMVLSKCLIEIPEGLVVVRQVFIVLIWHSVKPLDFW